MCLLLRKGRLMSCEEDFHQPWKFNDFLSVNYLQKGITVCVCVIKN